MKNLFLACLVCCSFSVQAHSLHLFAQYDGQRLSGNAYYSDQTPAAETYVEAHALTENGEETALHVAGKTDQAGHFSFTLLGAKAVKVVVEGEEGHRAERLADNLTQSQPERNEFEILRRDIQQLKNHIALHDILGGIGYIFGLFGVVALWKAHKEKK